MKWDMINERLTQNVIRRILKKSDHLEDLRAKGRALLEIDLYKWRENVE
jgi:hypothetical protein